MEQLLYYLNNTSSTLDQWLGVFNFIFIFVVLPIAIQVGIVYIIVRIINHFMSKSRRKTKNQLK